MDEKPVIGIVVVAVAVAMFGLGWVSNNVEEPEPEKVTVEVPVATTPDSCAVALAAAEDVMRVSAKALGVSQRAVEAASDLNVDAVIAKAKVLDSLAPDLRKPIRVYERASKACRAS